jgi:predicted nuclease of predicted toxin-antitoxin system
VRLLLDEDCGSRHLLKALRSVGHDASRVVDIPALGSGTSDLAIYEFGVADDRVLMTKNAADFLAISGLPGAAGHAGILAIYYNDDGTSLPIETVVRAVSNIESLYKDCDGLLLSVNDHVWPSR